MLFNDTLKTVMSAAIKCKNNIALIGEPGIGKSSFVEDFAENILCSKCFTLACNQLADKADLTGARLVPYSAPDGSQSYKQVFYPHQSICDAIDYANDHPNETPVLFLDEINRTTSDVTSAALSLTTLRRIGSIQLPDNLIIMVAGNDKGNVSSLDEASISRFIKINVTPDAETFLKLDDTLNPYIRQVLNNNRELIFCKSLDTTVKASGDDDDDAEETLAIDDIITDGEGMRQITTPRTISALSIWLNNLQQKDILAMLMTPATVEGVENSNVFTECVVGFVGYTNFTTKLIELIQMNINNQTANTASATPDKPSCFDTLKGKATTTIDELNDYIDSLNDKQKSASLLYAMYESDDNRVLVKTLAGKMTRLETPDMKLFVTMFANGQFPKSVTGVASNADTFISETTLGSQLASLGVV